MGDVCDTHLPTDFLHRCARLCLPEGEGYLLIRVTLLHWDPILLPEVKSSRIPYFHAGTDFGEPVRWMAGCAA
jgi:hypothetical protein